MNAFHFFHPIEKLCKFLLVVTIYFKFYTFIVKDQIFTHKSEVKTIQSYLINTYCTAASLLVTFIYPWSKKSHLTNALFILLEVLSI